MILAAENQKNKGMSLEENTSWLEENHLHICHWFTVDDLDLRTETRRTAYFPTIAWISGKLKIKPILRIVRGELSVREKFARLKLL